jgi:hypothetical protein
MGRMNLVYLLLYVWRTGIINPPSPIGSLLVDLGLRGFWQHGQVIEFSKAKGMPIT